VSGLEGLGVAQLETGGHTRQAAAGTIPSSTSWTCGGVSLVFLPIAVPEMVFGIYLIVRGFAVKAVADLSSETSHQA
jgi:hypothetical protein